MVSFKDTEVTVSFPGALVVKNSPASAGDVRDTGSSILAWRIPWTEEPGGLQVPRVAKSQT